MHVSKYRVAANNVFISIISFVIGGFGVRLVIRGSTIHGTIVVLASCLFFYIFGYLWTREIDNTVLQVESTGIRYYEHFVAWSDISDIELVRRSKAPDKLLLTLNSGQSLTILDNFLTMSMDELQRQIKTRM